MTNANATAKAPSRSNRSITLSWGMISIPLSVYSGSEGSASVARKMFTEDGHEVGRMDYDKVTGEKVVGAIVKKAQATSGEFVELTDEEIEAATEGPAKGLAQIEAFIPLSEIGTTYVIDGVNQIRVSRKAVGKTKVEDPAAAKAFTLLRSAMKAEGVAALVKVAASRGPVRYAAVTPDGRLLTLLFADQVREDLPLVDAEVSEAEMVMGRQLISAVGISTPVLTDENTARVQAFVDSKATGVVAAPVVAPVATATVDLMAALQASIDASKKAVA